MAKHAQESGPAGGIGTGPITNTGTEMGDSTTFNADEPDGAQKRLAGDSSWQPIVGGHNSDHGE